MTTQSPEPNSARRKTNANFEQGGDIFHPAPCYAVKTSSARCIQFASGWVFEDKDLPMCQGPILGGKFTGVDAASTVIGGVVGGVTLLFFQSGGSIFDQRLPAAARQMGNGSGHWQRRHG